MQSGIYRIRNMINDKCYVGSARDFRTRWNTHRCLLRQGKHHCSHLQSAWVRDGSESFAFEVIELCDQERLIEREQFWMDSLSASDRKCGYNARPVASNQTGLIHTAKTIDRISQAKQGTTPWNKGIPMSDEAKGKLRLAKLGRKHSEKTKRLMSEQRKGRRHCAETRKLMSEIAKAKGRKPPMEAWLNSAEVRGARAKEKHNDHP